MFPGRSAAQHRHVAIIPLQDAESAAPAAVPSQPRAIHVSWRWVCLECLESKTGQAMQLFTTKHKTVTLSMDPEPRHVTFCSEPRCQTYADLEQICWQTEITQKQNKHISLNAKKTTNTSHLNNFTI